MRRVAVFLAALGLAGQLSNVSAQETGKSGARPDAVAPAIEKVNREESAALVEVKALLREQAEQFITERTDGLRVKQRLGDEFEVEEGMLRIREQLDLIPGFLVIDSD